MGRSIIVVGMVLIIGVATLIFAMSTMGSADTNTVNSNNMTRAISQGCPSNYNGFGSADENQTYPSYPILSMPTNSVAVVCLKFHNPTGVNQTIGPAQPSWFEIGTFYSQPYGNETPRQKITSASTNHQNSS